MRIAQIAPLWHSIPPKKYGGAELIVSLLTEGLVKRGHKVTLFASRDSKTKAKLLSCIPYSFEKLKDVGSARSLYQVLNTSLAYQRAQEFDIIHDHITFDYFGLFFTPFVKTKTISTLHNLIYAFLPKYFPRHHYVAISKSLKKSQALYLKNISVVYNGIAVEKFIFSPRSKDYLVWLGRFTYEKGPHLAIQIAQKAKKKLILAAPLWPEDKLFFQKEIKPHLGKNIKYIGEVGHKEKVELLKSANCLLAPITWEEPFGLVMVEAMACGTPVIAFKRGSVPEIIEEGRTGFMVKNVHEAVRAIKKTKQISRKACRERVERLFSQEKMVEGYEKVYARMLKKKK